MWVAAREQDAKVQASSAALQDAAGKIEQQVTCLSIHLGTSISMKATEERHDRAFQDASKEAS